MQSSAGAADPKERWMDEREIAHRGGEGEKRRGGGGREGGGGRWRERKEGEGGERC